MTGPGLLVLTCLLATGREAPVDFDTEVIPILSRSGCNTGACHGAAIGRGGFKLSLLGGDPARDYEAVVHKRGGRRRGGRGAEGGEKDRSPAGPARRAGGRT